MNLTTTPFFDMTNEFLQITISQHIEEHGHKNQEEKIEVICWNTFMSKSPSFRLVLTMSAEFVAKVINKEEFQVHLNNLWECHEGIHFDFFFEEMVKDDYENDLDRLRKDLEDHPLWSLAVVCGKTGFVWYEVVKYQTELWLCRKCIKKQHEDDRCGCGLRKADFE